MTGTYPRLSRYLGMDKRKRREKTEKGRKIYTRTALGKTNRVTGQGALVSSGVLWLCGRVVQVGCRTTYILKYIPTLLLEGYLIL